MSYPFDATLKDLLAQNAADLLRVFSYTANEPTQILNVDLSTVSAATDVAIGIGEPLREIVDLNFQSGRPDAGVAARLLLYNAALHFRFHVPIRSILVLLRPKADSSLLTGELTYLSGELQVSFQYKIVRMWEQPLEAFLEGGPDMLPLAPLCRLPRNMSKPAALRHVISEIDRRLAMISNHAKAVRLMTAAFVLTGLRVPKKQLREVFDGVKIMHETVAWDEYLEEGMVKGELKAILKIGTKQFGKPAAKTKAALMAIQDLNRLDRMLDEVMNVKSWTALLSVK